MRAHDGPRAARVMSEHVEGTTHMLGALLPSGVDLAPPGALQYCG